MARFADFIHRSIARKLAVYIIGTGIIVALVGMLARLAFSYFELVPELQQEVTHLSQAKLEVMQQAIATDDRKALQQHLAEIVSHSGVDAVALIYTNTSNKEAKLNYPTNFQPTDDIYEVPLKLAVPAQLKLHAQLNMQDVYRKLRLLIAENIFLIALQAFIISVLLLVYMERIFAKHLRAIAQYAQALHLQNLNEEFDYTRKKHIQTPDELDSVAIAINRMRKKLVEDLQARAAIEKAWQQEKEEKLKTQRKILAAEAANRAKSQFIATMSHEIRTPMNGIIGMIDLLNHTQLNEQQKHFVDIIHRSGASLITVINDILDYSKIEADKMTLEKVAFDLDELLDDCLQLFSAITAQNKLNLYCHIDPNIPARLKGDPTRLKQILLNLIGNAFKFTHKGYVQLSVELLQPSTNEPANQQTLLRFSIEDTGIGIDADAQSNLFRAFKQADNSTTRRFGGTGLGLAISKKLVTLMGGEIGVESQLHHGATFWFTANLGLLKYEPLDTHVALSDKTLLFICDDQRLSDAVVKYCSAWGTLATVCSAKTAASQNFDADWVMLDLSSNQTSTQKICSRLQSLPPAKQPSLILLGQHNDETTKPLQFDALLSPPLTRRKLQQTLIQLSRPTHLSKATTAPALSCFSNLKVLVAEDNSVNQLVIEGLLKQLGITPAFAANGREAVEHMQKHPTDVIFMDCEMPVMDGFTATEAIRKWESASNAPAATIIALTAHVESDHKMRVYSSGMDHYLSKPVTLAEIESVLQNIEPEELQRNSEQNS